jgi:hypothetical protein
MNPCWKLTDAVRSILWGDTRILNHAQITGTGASFNSARRHVHEVVDDIISTRRSEPDCATGIATPDFVSQLLTAEPAKPPLVVRDTLVSLLFAGQDNILNILNWSMHSLLQNPKWMANMREEAISQAHKNTSGLAYENIKVSFLIVLCTRFLWRLIGLQHSSSSSLRNYQALARNSKKSSPSSFRRHSSSHT